VARIPERIRWKAVTRGSQEKSPGQKRRELYAKRHEQVLEKRSLGKSTSELLEKAQGKGQLATETLKEMMLKLLPLAQNHYPLDKNGNWRKRRNPDLGETESVGTLFKTDQGCGAIGVPASALPIAEGSRHEPNLIAWETRRRSCSTSMVMRPPSRKNWTRALGMGALNFSTIQSFFKDLVARLS
jgi:hypothetical protein